MNQLRAEQGVAGETARKMYRLITNGSMGIEVTGAYV